MRVLHLDTGRTRMIREADAHGSGGDIIDDESGETSNNRLISKHFLSFLPTLIHQLSHPARSLARTPIPRGVHPKRSRVQIF